MLLQPLIKTWAWWAMRKTYSHHSQAVAKQRNILLRNIKRAQNTAFGKDHDFAQIRSVQDFQKAVPVRSYQDFSKYNEAVTQGKEDVTWPGKPLYFAKTSGTTSGSKYIPISKDSIQSHIRAARNALFAYVNRTSKADFFTGKMIFLQGSPQLEEVGGINTGRLSGIVYHHVPKWLLGNRKPSYETNCITDWPRKVEAITEETLGENMTLISGIPPWCIDYFHSLASAYAKKHGMPVEQVDIKRIFPELQLYVYGGLNYEPYRNTMQRWLGPEVDTIETYPASEGFFAYQDSAEPGLLLNVNDGMFFEFIPMDTYHKETKVRHTLADVELNKQYALVVSSNAGLWAYDTGDTVRFTSLAPYRLVVTGRTKHFISAFGEHVIQEEVERAIAYAAEKLGSRVTEFTVAPFWSEAGNGHEWFIETQDGNATQWARLVDQRMQEQNGYYRDLRQGKTLILPKITFVPKGGFRACFAAENKLGGQNKVIHVANDRAFAQKLLASIGSL